MPHPLSIAARLFISASVVLTTFLGLTGYALDQAFQASTRVAVKERLQAHLFTLIAEAELQDAITVNMPTFLLEPRFGQSDSGLYARIIGFRQKILWQSASFTQQTVPLVAGLQATEEEFTVVYDAAGLPYFLYAMGVTWDQLRQMVYVFNVMENWGTYSHEVSRFRQRLWLWLGGVGLILLLVQWLVLRWGLSPLRRAAAEIKCVETGEHEIIQGRYPTEIAGLTGNLNALLQGRRAQLSRYRHALGDLAHSLKTPLALLRGEVDAPGAATNWRVPVGEQIDRMKRIIDYQLQRAATSGRQPLSQPIRLFLQVDKVRKSLDKVYSIRNIQCDIEIKNTLLFYGDESDLIELLGNVMDNAYIWCNQQVCVTAQESDIKPSGKVLQITVEDDGSGVSDELCQQVIERGMRAQDDTGGSGIGLAIVQDIIQAYQGHLVIERSHLGGAAVRMTFQM